MENNNDIKIACEFNPQACSSEDTNKTIECPLCHHWVVLGLPHPNFFNNSLPINEEELCKLSLTPFASPPITKEELADIRRSLKEVD
jgi:hypothetical protein